MNALMWCALGFSIWICLAMFVLALGKAAARGDEDAFYEDEFGS